MQRIAEATRAAHPRQPAGHGFVVPIAGGVATFAEPGSPFNKLAGLGFGGAPSSAGLQEIEQAFAACGVDVQVELSHLGDSRIGSLLADRGYRVTRKGFPPTRIFLAMCSLGLSATSQPLASCATSRGATESAGGASLRIADGVAPSRAPR